MHASMATKVYAILYAKRAGGRAPKYVRHAPWGPTTFIHR